MSRKTDIVERTIAEALARSGVGRSERILIALSGGADSVALIHALHGLRDGHDRVPYELTAAHLNHRLRGDESDRDENFVRELCNRLQIELFVEHADGLAVGSNLEERARDLRYEFLNRTADRVGARHIALAHHGDDQAETVLMRLMRGSGVAGLAAMDVKGPGRIIRPMIALCREQILEYLDARGVSYVTDSSNLSPAILRNRVRHELLPMLERDYAPGLGERLVELSDEMRSLDDYITREARRELTRRLGSADRMNRNLATDKPHLVRAMDSLDLYGFGQLHPALANAMLREWLRMRFGDLRAVYRDDIARVGWLCAKAAPGSVAELTGGWRVRCEYGTASIEQARTNKDAYFNIELALDGMTEVCEAGFRFVARTLRRGDSGFPAEPSMPGADPMEAYFDADEVGSDLIVRSFRQGDRIKPLGMTGTRKVQDVFVDRKLPRERRSIWPIIEAQSEVIWIPGMVRSRAALVTSTTQNLLQLTAKPEDRA
ncbi:MAG: tRNA lysidine(34) synthetase TilS [Deltaproteobacteria bacterium]|nr:tRNA lysidine(34) synthetase TilS [Deltaproteobacteria bacterium]